MRIWHFSDSHGHHSLIKVPEDIDLIIFSGDCANFRDKWRNEPEVKDFLNWFSSLDTPKIMIGGNHDSSIEHKVISSQDFVDRNIMYLENEDITIDGIKIWGSPYTPTFGDWAFMKARHNMYKIWDQIPEDTDIVVTHGPGHGTLDLSYEMDGVTIKQCGCKNLKKRINKIKPKFHLFGHIHDSMNGELLNQGLLVRGGVTYSNGSVVTDGKFGKVTSHGVVIEI